ncbi:hypothetical protein [Thermosporothrix hazakensis]|nr:hypothetical protein [Thermosporothrix hazakensis]
MGLILLKTQIQAFAKARKNATGISPLNATHASLSKQVTFQRWIT